MDVKKVQDDVRRRRGVIGFPGKVAKAVSNYGVRSIEQGKRCPRERDVVRVLLYSFQPLPENM